MKSFHNYFVATVLLLVGLLAATGQTPAPDAKQFAKDGLSFSYPNGWTVQDSSNADALQLNLGRNDSDAQIRVFVFRTPVNTPARVAEARKVLVDPYIAATTKSFVQMGANPQSSPATTDISTVKSDGVKISATLDGDPGAAQIFWGVVGQKLVVLTLFGPDRAVKRALPAWDTLRTSLAIEEPKPPPTPAPKPSATPAPK